ncbi:hypothetical protein GQ53DRAFT_785441 [Thozetella sp. PMI_491]|nr:hypothetical protein GQ53DRAFT_785441 [Thozetella sp. PMI_491]
MAFTIRPHQKSRGGCVSCKARRVKCDESRPTCRHCVRRGNECVYTEPQKRRRPAPPETAQEPPGEEAAATTSEGLSPGASPAPVARPKPRPKAKAKAAKAGGDPSQLGGLSVGSSSVPRSPPSGYTPKHMLDLRLMHQYAAATATSISDIFQLNPMAASALKSVIPKLSVEHPFLMDTILGIAAIHLGSNMSTDASAPVPVAQYRDKALYNLRKATMALSNQNLRPIHMASMLLASTSLAADRTLNYPGLWVSNWIAMAAGPRVLTESRHTPPPSPTQEPVRPVPVHAAGLEPDRLTPAVMPIDLDKILDIPEDDEDWRHRAVLREAAGGIAELFGALCLEPGGGLTVEFKVRAWPFSLTSSYFLDLVRQERPRALIILAYFIAFVSYLPDTWMYAGAAVRDMDKLVKMIHDPAWRELVTVPSVALTIENRVARSDFLRTQLTGHRQG